MVLKYYKLAEQPFGVTPDPGYLFLSATHREALASVLHGVNAGRGFTALIALPGMGKTTLLFDFLNKVKDECKTVFLFQSQSKPEDLFRSLLADLGIEDDGNDFVLMQRKLNDCLAAESSRGKKLIVVLDEAQNLDDSVLEFIRMLSNFETSREKMMHLVLSGQPELADKLATPQLMQLRQRISIVARLMPFSPDETSDYIEHRLRVAGFDFSKPLFSKQALALIASYTEGIPRNINNVCFNAMSIGFVSKQRTIEVEVIREVIQDLDLGSTSVEPVSVANLGLPGFIRTDPVSLVPPGPRLGTWSLRLALTLALLGLVIWPLISGGGQAWIVLAASRFLPSYLSRAVPANSFPESSQSLPVPQVSLSNVLQTADSAQSATPLQLQHSDPGLIRISHDDTLYQICLRTYGRYDPEILARVRELNPWITDPRRIRVGREIRVPARASIDEGHDTKSESVSTMPVSGAEKP